MKRVSGEQAPDIVRESTSRNFDGEVLFPLQALPVVTGQDGTQRFEYNPGEESGEDPYAHPAENTVHVQDAYVAILKNRQVPEPYVFELYNERSGKWTHVKVLQLPSSWKRASSEGEVAEEACYISQRVMAQLRIDIGQRVLLRYVQLPLAGSVYFLPKRLPRSQSAFTETMLRLARSFATFTVGDEISVQAVSGNERYEVVVVKVTPDVVHAVSAVRYGSRVESVENEGGVYQFRVSNAGGPEEPEYANFDVRVGVARREEGAQKKRRPLRSQQVLSLPARDYENEFTGVDLTDGRPDRVAWFLDLGFSFDALALNPYSLFAREAAQDKRCDICLEPLLGEPDEGFQFFPRFRGNGNARGDPVLYPLCGMAQHARRPYPGKVPRKGDTRRDGVRLPGPRSLDVRHIECQLSFFSQALISTEGDFAMPVNAERIPPVTWYLGREARETLQWHRLPEAWLWPVLLQQKVTFSVRLAGGEEEDEDEAEERVLIAPFFEVLRSIANRGGNKRERKQARSVFFPLVTVLLDEVPSPSRRVATLRGRAREALRFEEFPERQALAEARNASASLAAQSGDLQELRNLAVEASDDVDWDKVARICARRNSVACMQLLEERGLIAFQQPQLATDYAAVAARYDSKDVFLWLFERFQDKAIFLNLAAQNGAGNTVRALLETAPFTFPTLLQTFQGAVVGIVDSGPYNGRDPGERNVPENDDPVPAKAYFEALQALVEADPRIVQAARGDIRLGLVRNLESVDKRTGLSYNGLFLRKLLKWTGKARYSQEDGDFFGAALLDGSTLGNRYDLLTLLRLTESVSVKFLQNLVRNMNRNLWRRDTVVRFLSLPFFDAALLRYALVDLIHAVTGIGIREELPVRCGQYLARLGETGNLQVAADVPLFLAFQAETVGEVYPEKVQEAWYDTFLQIAERFAERAPLPEISQAQAQALPREFAGVFPVSEEK